MQYKVCGRQHRNDKCLVCGFDNPLGLELEFWELENGEIAAYATTREEHQSYPGRTHGGIISSLLDEVVGRAISIAEPECFGVTVDLDVKFKKPVPIGEKLLIVGRITRNRSRMFEGSGEIYLDEDKTLLATATASYMKLAVNKIVDGDFRLDDSNWRICEDEPQPEFIELPY
jgi:uncharacterized protein (TIGR00369 family)